MVLCFHSRDETETDSEVEDRVDGVKSWLSKNKTSTKTVPDEGSLKSTRFVLTSFLHHNRYPSPIYPCGGEIKLHMPRLEKAQSFWGNIATDKSVFHVIRCHLSLPVISGMTASGIKKWVLSSLLKLPMASRMTAK